MRVVVVDTGLGNLRSVEKALLAAGSESDLSGLEVQRSADPDAVRRADRLVFPGQGAFRDCVLALQSGLGDALTERIRSGAPYFGICLGLQVLFEKSDEAPGARGLGLFSGHVERLGTAGGVKIPHMGWNQLELGPAPHHPLLQRAGDEGTWFYFVHSFHAVADDPTLVTARCHHGPNEVTAAVARDNVFACQFHPEKSQAAGLRLLAAFLSS
jgi:glutamine amidotransferase